jgi:hypothetical protein
VIDMVTIIRLVLGLVALAFITFMSALFGIGGFFFCIGLFVVIVFAFDH